MWTYTVYTLYKYCLNRREECKELEFRRLADLFFRKLWREQGIVFHDSKHDLYADLQYLRELGILELLGDEKNLDSVIIRIKDFEKLKEIAKAVEQSYALTGIKLFSIYKDRIDNTLRE